MKPKVLGIGLPRTGTKSLHAALLTLGWNSAHCTPERFPLCGISQHRFLAAYNGVDALSDFPACFFYPELRKAFPELRCILTVRDTDKWWQSIALHHLERLASGSAEDVRDTKRCHSLLFGTESPHEWLWKRAYVAWNDRAMKDIPAKRLLALDVSKPVAWQRLCAFLDVPMPAQPFPWENRLATPAPPVPVRQRHVPSSRRHQS